MNQHFEVVGVSSEGYEHEEIRRDEGIRTIKLNMSREITPFQDMVSLVKMIFLLLKEKPDIVHTHTPKAGIVGMIAAFSCRVPHRLHTVAGLPVMEARGKKKKLLLMIEKLTYACATKVYPNSYGLKDYILEHQLTSKKKLKIIGNGSSNGIDTTYFDRTDEVLEKAEEIKEKYNLEDKFVFCFIGRVVKDKGINELLYAFDKLTQEFNNARLFIVGGFENELDPISEESLYILKNNKNILHVGFQDDIRPYLTSSDCFVLPSYREGFPNVVLQAGSMGLFSIVTNINGCNEIIENNKNGLIVKVKDTYELHLAMENYINNKDLLKKLRLNIKNAIIKKYDKKIFYTYLLKEYRGILGDDKNTI